jgi:hypothetical protein
VQRRCRQRDDEQKGPRRPFDVARAVHGR